MNKVVKCKNDTCAQHFMHTEIDTKCPFCHIEYVELNEVTIKKEINETKDFKETKDTKKKFETIKPSKDSFKMWKVDVTE